MYFPNQKGRNAVLFIVIITFAISVAQVTQSVTDPLEQIVPLLLTAILGWFLYGGYNWARWVMMILLGFAALVSLIGGVFILFDDIWNGLLLVLPALFYLVALSVFLYGPNVKEHFGA